MKKSSLKAALLCSLVFAGCSTNPQGRKQLTAPLPVSEAYSEADLRIQLATASSVSTPCIGVECTRNQEFEQQVQSVGYRLAMAAYDTYPDLIKRVSEFQFEVAAKSEPGSASNAAGRIVIYRGVQELGFDEAGVAFLVAREMGHVIGQHHEENSGTKILLSIAVGVLFPALHLFNGTAQLAQATQATQATSATVLGTTVASTATSYVGSKAILAGLRPDQLSEADLIALGLLDKEGWHLHDVASILDKSEKIKGGGSWDEDLRVSIAHLRVLDTDNQSIDLTQQTIALHVQRECSAEPEEDISTEEPVSDVPVMALEVAPALQPTTDAEPSTPEAESQPELTETVAAPEKIPDLPQAAPADAAIQPPVKLQTAIALQRSTTKKPSLGKPLKPKPSKLAPAKKTPHGKVVKVQKPSRPKTAKPKIGSKPTRTVKPKPIR